MLDLRASSQTKKWATDYRFLNDSEEGYIAERAIRDIATRLAAEPKMLSTFWTSFLAHYPRAKPTEQFASILVTSFSEEENDLSQWRAYGKAMSGGGYAIGFRAADLNDLVKCQYSELSFGKR